jgi:hypothetical protein
VNTVEKAVARAESAYKAYRKAAVWGSDEELLADLLADVMHLVDLKRLDREIGDFSFDDLLATARTNYEAEKEGSE